MALLVQNKILHLKCVLLFCLRTLFIDTVYIDNIAALKTRILSILNNSVQLSSLKKQTNSTSNECTSGSNSWHVACCCRPLVWVINTAPSCCTKSHFVAKTPSFLLINLLFTMAGFTWSNILMDWHTNKKSEKYNSPNGPRTSTGPGPGGWGLLL